MFRSRDDDRTLEQHADTYSAEGTQSRVLLMNTVDGIYPHIFELTTTVGTKRWKTGTRHNFVKVCGVAIVLELSAPGYKDKTKVGGGARRGQITHDVQSWRWHTVHMRSTWRLQHCDNRSPEANSKTDKG